METVRKMTIEQALSLFEQLSIKRGNALNKGNSKTANYCYDKIKKVVSFLKENEELPKLSAFYNHSNPQVRLTAAAYLLPIFEKESLNVLKEVSKEENIIGLCAEMTIQEWKNGNLKNFYTLQNESKLVKLF